MHTIHSAKMCGQHAFPYSFGMNGDTCSSLIEKIGYKGLLELCTDAKSPKLALSG